MTHFFNDLKTDEKFLVGLFIVLKIALLIVMPLTGDEAYFMTWGEELSLGYYDHPPMVGWVIYFLSFISDHYYTYRIFAFLIAIVVSMLVYQLVLQYHQPKTALLIALTFFVSPIALIIVILTNDVVMFLFGFLGFYYFVNALDHNSARSAIVAGLFFGLAFLSKYLSIILIIALLIYALLNKIKYYKLFIIMAVIAAVLGLENLYFNMDSCWNNIVFNLVARNSSSTFSYGTLTQYLLSILILVPPYGFYLLTRSRQSSEATYLKPALYAVVFSFIFYLFLSAYKTIGLHWLMLYIPLMYLLFSKIPVEKLSSLLKYNAVISILMAIALITISTQYDDIFKKHERYSDIFLYTETEKVCAAFPPNETIFTLSYSTNSVLAAHCKNNQFHVISNLVEFGREDDKKINFAEFDQQNLYVFMDDEADKDKIEPYFERLIINAIDIKQGVRYALIKSEKFNFERYKSEILKTLSEKFYTNPDWLPAATCRFNEKYEFSTL